MKPTKDQRDMPQRPTHGAPGAKAKHATKGVGRPRRLDGKFATKSHAGHKPRPIES